MTEAPFDPAKDGAAMNFRGTMSYGDYLRLDKLLDAQHPLTAAHDELLFIIQHQTSELWMKLAIHELNAARQRIADDDLRPAFKMLARVSRIFEQLNSAWDVLRTMTPSEYTHFRDALGQSSGFQSYQYRMVEYLVGNKNAAMMRPHEHDRALLAELEAVRQAPSLYDLTIATLHRRGFAIDDKVLARDIALTHVADDSVRAAWAAIYREPERFWELYELAEKLALAVQSCHHGRARDRLQARHRRHLGRGLSPKDARSGAVSRTLAGEDRFMSAAGAAIHPIVDWDDAYANAAHIPDGASYPQRWAERAAAFRERLSGARARLDLPYGPAPRNRLDIFLPDGQSHGLVVFVHGGFWKAFDKSAWSHLAEGALASGRAVAIPSYTLCPDARIAEITREIAAAVEFVASEVPGPISLCGHSAGGHLVVRMICRASPLDERTALRIARTVSISGLHDLRPLMATKMNASLRIDWDEALVESPALLAPRPGQSVVAWVGADERPEFIRQSRLLEMMWRGFDARMTMVEEPGRHHFSVLDGLAEPRHPLTKALVAG
jgi:tryptophan 2,3-dioxygenase